MATSNHPEPKDLADSPGLTCHFLFLNLSALGLTCSKPLRWQVPPPAVSSTNPGLTICSPWSPNFIIFHSLESIFVYFILLFTDEKTFMWTTQTGQELYKWGKQRLWKAFLDGSHSSPFISPFLHPSQVCLSVCVCLSPTNPWVPRPRMFSLLPVQRHKSGGPGGGHGARNPLPSWVSLSF